VVGTRRTPGGFRLDAQRHRLTTRILEAAGEARRLAAARGERSAAVAALGRAAWLEAWEEAAAGVSQAVLARIDGYLAAEGRAAGMPRRVLRRVLLDEAEHRALAARLGSAGAGLVSALDQLEERGRRVPQATPAERHDMDAWQDALRTAARRLEAAWLELEDAVAHEADRWRTVGEEIAGWRRPLWPVLTLGAVGLAAAAALGLVLGGYLEAPAWFAAWWNAALPP
jgi:hypothetical protein